ncbi:MAG: phosphotransferase [Flavipsychrobacter sp.]|nr:phosphotransferase [Flavipsychrobacter sp.]
MNHSYLVIADGREYVLRIYNHKHRDLLQVTEEVKLLDALKASVSVSYPILGADKEFVHAINAPEGSRYLVLYSFAQGKKQRFLTPEQNYRIGTEVGRLHHFTREKTIQRTDYSVETLVNWAYRQTKKYISDDLDEMRFIGNCVPALIKVFSQLPLTKGVVHLDIWYDNMSIREDSSVTLFDFDNCGNGWLILDIGYYCMQLFFVEQDKSEYEKKKTAFLDGYLSVAQIPDAEFEVIPYAGLAIWIYYLGVQSQRFDNFANIFLSENYVKMYIGRVKDWLKYNNIEIK